MSYGAASAGPYTKPTQSLGGTALYPQTDPPGESPSRIRNTICNIEQALENMASSLVVLEKRFDTVLAPPSPATPAGNGSAQNAMVSSDVNQRLQLVLDRLLGLNQWVNVLTDRAEV